VNGKRPENPKHETHNDKCLSILVRINSRKQLQSSDIWGCGFEPGAHDCYEKFAPLWSFNFTDAAAYPFSHHGVQNGSGAHPISYPMGTAVSFPRGKAAVAWSWPLTSI